MGKSSIQGGSMFFSETPWVLSEGSESLVASASAHQPPNYSTPLDPRQRGRNAACTADTCAPRAGTPRHNQVIIVNKLVAEWYCFVDSDTH